LIRYLRTLFRNLFRRQRVEHELDEEVSGYLALLAADKVRAGALPEEALLEARRELGHPEQLKESVRDIRIGAFMDALMQDIRYARGVAAGQSPLRSALIVGQVAMALVLLIGAGLLAKSFWKLVGVSPGFRIDHVLTARISLPPRYTNGYVFGTGRHRAISRFQQELLDRLRVTPGVQSAAFTAYLPLSGDDNAGLSILKAVRQNRPVSMTT